MTVCGPRLTSLALLLLAGGVWAAGGGLRLNEIQVLGSHNSYKLAMPADNFARLRARDADAARALEYTHLPLARQLDLGIRALELDVFYDPDGTLFPGVTAASGSRFPVLHVQILDDRSSCPDLLTCLSEVAAWSASHPRHVPVFISFNAKDQVIHEPGFVRPRAFDEEAWLAMDAEIRSVLGKRLLEPGRIVAGGKPRWPLLAEARGRFLAILDEGGDKRASYAGRWRERAMFATVPVTEPGAAVLVINDPMGRFQEIQRAVRLGYIVRTRADADTLEARLGETARRDRAFASGAQIVSTDYYLPAGHFGTGYVVTLPGGARCNPLLRPAACRLTEQGE